MKLAPNQMYYWQDCDRIIGAMRVRVKGVNDVFGYGFMIEDSEILKYEMSKRGRDITDKDFTLLNRKRAVSQVKIQLANVYNALKVHGQSILDNKGNIDPDLYALHENKLRIQGGTIVDTNITHPFKALKDFKAVEITVAEAASLDLT